VTHQPTTVETDQSIKIGDTRSKTVLAFSNRITFAVVIPARAKRQVLAWLRRHQKLTALSYIRLFSAALFLLFKDHLSQIAYIVIDVEYPGYDRTIRSFLLEYFKRTDPGFSSDWIVFRRIGKKSRAHQYALAVQKGTIAPNRIIKTKELIALLR